MEDIAARILLKSMSLLQSVSRTKDSGCRALGAQQGLPVEPESTLGVRQNAFLLGHAENQVDNAAGIAPFVIIPSYDFEEVTIEFQA